MVSLRWLLLLPPAADAAAAPLPDLAVAAAPNPGRGGSCGLPTAPTVPPPDGGGAAAAASAVAVADAGPAVAAVAAPARARQDSRVAWRLASNMNRVLRAGGGGSGWLLLATAA